MFPVFWAKVLAFLDTPMEEPAAYGWFHLFFFVLSIVAGVLLCLFFKNGKKYAPRIVFTTAVIVFVLEIYKMINYSFSYEGGIAFDFQWYAFPFQFCSTPMYVGLLVGLLRKGKIHDALCAYLATYAVFAGLCVMVYPNTVFISTIGINIQTMICHGSMITIGIYLLGSGHVRAENRTILKAIPVFGVMVAIAMGLNEWAHRSGLLERENFNMFYFSPYQDPHLPVYSDVQNALGLANPLSFVIYVAAFTLAAYLMLVIAMGIRRTFAPRRRKIRSRA